MEDKISPKLDEKPRNTGVLQALRVHYGGKRAVSQALYPYRGSAYIHEKAKSPLLIAEGFYLYSSKKLLQS